MKNLSLILFLALIASPMHAQEATPYQIYKGTGEAAGFSTLVNAASEARVVLFGELHDNALGHWLQLQLAKALHARHNLVLGAEMLERDDQLLISE